MTVSERKAHNSERHNLLKNNEIKELQEMYMLLSERVEDLEAKIEDLIKTQKRSNEVQTTQQVEDSEVSITRIANGEALAMMIASERPKRKTSRHPEPQEASKKKKE
ncbi:unnamed protein product [Aphanomyces euteiches]